MNRAPKPTDLLPRRLEEIAHRRLPESAVQPVLEATLRRIEDRDAEVASSDGQLLHCLRLLREEICAYYAEHPPRLTWAAWTPEKAPVVVEAMDPESLRQVSEAAMDDLAEESPAACVYLRRLSTGATPREVAAKVHGGLDALRRRLHRGRDLLDRFLVARGART